MMEMQEKTQADFDLEKLFELIDEALTSKDERVQNALRSLLMIVTLTRVREDGDMEINDRARGPLRQMQQDLNDISRRLYRLQDELHNLKMPREGAGGYPYNPGAGSPFGPNWTTGDDTNGPYTTSKTSSSYIPPGPFLTDPDDSATINIKLTK